MKTFNIDKFYIELHIQEKRIMDVLGESNIEYNPTSTIIYYKLLGKKIKIYEINKVRHNFIDDYEFNRVKLYRLLPLYIDDINTYKHNTITTWNEVRIIHSKIYYNICNIKTILNKIKNRFRKSKVCKYDLGY